MSLTKSATPTVILYDQTTTFTLIARNAGPNTATNATLNDTLPSGLLGMTFLSATGFSGGTLTSPRRLLAGASDNYFLSAAQNLARRATPFRMISSLVA